MGVTPPAGRPPRGERQPDRMPVATLPRSKASCCLAGEQTRYIGSAWLSQVKPGRFPHLVGDHRSTRQLTTTGNEETPQGHPPHCLIP